MSKADDLIVAELQMQLTDSSAPSLQADDAFDAGIAVVGAEGNMGVVTKPPAPGNAHKALAIGDYDAVSGAVVFQVPGLIDGRTKPDVQCPSNVDAAGNGSFTAKSLGFGGTSAATAFAGGAASLMYEWFSAAFGITNKPGHLYATLLAQGDAPTMPSIPNGAGRLKLKSGLRPCIQGDLCNDLVASGWERTIVGRRVLTCVTSWLESRLQGPAPEVTHYSADGIPGGPPLPPFSDAIHATLSFGRALNWAEANEVAKHPFVARVWTSDALQIATQPPGCPPDYDAPAQTPMCMVTTEAIDSKFAPASRAIWEVSNGPNEVVISVRRDMSLCPLPACPGSAIDCPERQKYLDYNAKVASGSQTCVRAAVVAIGGTASPEVIVAGNGFPATLTWAQIQTIAARSDVVQIDPQNTGAPPP